MLSAGAAREGYAALERPGRSSASARAGAAGTGAAGAAGAQSWPAAGARRSSAALMVLLVLLLILSIYSVTEQLVELVDKEGQLGAPAPRVVRGCSPVQLFSHEQIETFGTTLWFTYRSNILKERRPAHFYSNVLHTIACYNASMQGRAVARFLDDADCREMILSVSPDLAKGFDRERRGMIKADICRVAALYQSGGYYFDVDIEASRPLGLAAKPLH
jgi:hypothetical protein